MNSAENTIQVQHPAAMVLNAAVRALTAIGSDVENVDREAMTITAKVGASWRTWGEHVHVIVTSAGAEASTVEIQAKAAGLQVVDWGQSRQDIEKFERALQDQLRGEQGA